MPLSNACTNHFRWSAPQVFVAFCKTTVYKSQRPGFCLLTWTCNLGLGQQKVPCFEASLVPESVMSMTYGMNAVWRDWWASSNMSTSPMFWQRHVCVNEEVNREQWAQVSIKANLWVHVLLQLINFSLKLIDFFFLRTNFGTTPISGQSTVIPKHIIINGVVVAVTLGKWTSSNTWGESTPKCWRVNKLGPWNYKEHLVSLLCSSIL